MFRSGSHSRDDAGDRAAGARKGRRIAVLVLVLCAAVCGYRMAMYGNVNPSRRVGEVLDAFDGVAVYYNGGIGRTAGRNVSPEGYNIGLRHQCVEFVKRYYYERFHHIMPDSYGHARDFFDRRLADGALNSRRGLTQHRNGGPVKPAPGDMIVFAPWLLNRYGHVAIVSGADDGAVEIVQQNPGPFGSSRQSYKLTERDGGWHVEHRRVLGWLRLP